MKSAPSPLEGNVHLYPQENQWVRLKSSKSCRKSVIAKRLPLSRGHLVSHCNPDESHRLYRLGRQPAASCRNVRMACPPQQANGGVAQRRHDVGNVAAAHLGAVFIEGDIAYPMRLVLNGPMPAHQLQQTLGCRPLGTQTGDPIDHFCSFLARFWGDDVTPHLKDLCEPRPIAIAHQSLTGRDIALLDTPMATIHCARGLLTVAHGRERKD